MKNLILTFTLFYSINSFSQIADGLIKTEEFGTFSYEEIDKSLFNDHLSVLKQNMISYRIIDHMATRSALLIAEKENMEPFKHLIERDKQNLKIFTDKGTLVFESDTAENKSNYNYHFIDYIVSYDYFLLVRFGWEYHDFVIINKRTGRFFVIPANINIQPEIQTLASYYLDVVNGYGTIEIFRIIENNDIELQYKFIDPNPTFAFGFTFIDNNHNLFFESESFERNVPNKYYLVKKIK